MWQQRYNGLFLRWRNMLIQSWDANAAFCRPAKEGFLPRTRVFGAGFVATPTPCRGGLAWLGISAEPPENAPISIITDVVESVGLKAQSQRTCPQQGTAHNIGALNMKCTAMAKVPTSLVTPPPLFSRTCDKRRQTRQSAVTGRPRMWHGVCQPSQANVGRAEVQLPHWVLKVLWRRPSGVMHLVGWSTFHSPSYRESS